VGAVKSIEEIATGLVIPSEAWEPYGRWAAKVDPSRLAPRVGRPPGQIVLITGMTPSAGGVGKTVTTLTIASALTRRGVRAIACLRQPSLGPVFGIKGGGAGGGRATVEPLVEVNLGMTGDLDAVTSAHNLLASLIDNHLHHGNTLGIDPESIVWPRALDLEDRALRDIEIGRGTGNGPVRRSSFVITPASEITAILGLATGPEELEARLGRIVVGRTRSGAPVCASDLHASGAMAALLRRARLPNLLQTSDGSPVLVHGGPFGNLSYGTTTLTSLHVAQQLSDVALVEAGFATDLGAEKFVDLVAPLGDVSPSAAVIVASLPSIHAHAPGLVGAGSLGPGLENLEQHVANVRALGLDPVIALNRFPGDISGERTEVKSFCTGLSVRVEDANGFSDGALGGVGIAEAVVEALHRGQRAKPIYRPSQSLAEKIDIVVRTMYGGEGADLSDEARAEVARGDVPDGDAVPVCLAKTPLSLSDDPKKLGRPRGFRVQVRRFVRAAGAGYIVPLLGDIQTMPGLPRDPRAFHIGIDASGVPQGVV